MNILKEQEIGQFVAQDFRTASVFSTYGIDFCCRGNRSLQNVCDKNGIVIEDIIDELQQVVSTEANPSIDYKSWPLDLLATYIEKTHHKFVRSKIPVLLQFLNKLCDRHSENHPELLEIFSEFQNVSEELLEHMKKEENILLPQIIKMVSHMEENSPLPQSNFGTVQNPISMMEHEHDNAGEIFRTIARLSNNYNPPADACNTYRVTFAMLDEFEKNLHLHIHLENNILFPEALKLEQRFV